MFSAFTIQKDKKTAIVGSMFFYKGIYFSDQNSSIALLVQTSALFWNHFFLKLWWHLAYYDNIQIAVEFLLYFRSEKIKWLGLLVVQYAKNNVSNQKHLSLILVFIKSRFLLLQKQDWRFFNLYSRTELVQ